MKKYLVFVALFLMLSSCVHRPAQPPFRKFPVRRVKVFTWPVKVRVELLKFHKSLNFSVEGDIYLNGKTLLPEGNYSVRLKKVRAARFKYYRILMKTDDYEKAINFFHSLEKTASGDSVYFVDVGSIFNFKSMSVDNREYYVLMGPVKKKRSFRNLYYEPVSDPHGVFELFNDFGERIYEFEDSLVLETENGYFYFGRFHISGGKIILTVDTHGNGVIIFETDIEDYIKRVLPAEMPINFPIEALRAQSVVARTFTLANLGKFYRYQPYDFTSTVTSQAFQDKIFDIADSVVNSTRGIVLFYKDKLAHAYYHSTCGGHTEDITYIWGGESIPYLKGIKDGNFNLDLQDPIEVRIFIYSPPETILCNFSNDSAIVPYIRRNFRWRVIFKRKKIEKMVKEFTGKGIGRLLSITPIKRGVSGRITEIVISGTRRSVEIKGEYKIRKMFGGLRSSLFVVDYIRDNDGNIKSVILTGGGAGHGVGMCQVGAGILADRGFKMKDILKHYFPGVKGVKLY